MVVGAFPIAKLGLLCIKHISKPVSNVIKQYANKNNAFRIYVVAPPATLYNTIEVRSKLWMLGIGQPKRVPPLTRAMSIKMGGEILGELFIFLIGVSFILNEFARQARNSERKHERHKQKREELNNRIVELNERIARQDKEIVHLKAKVNQIESNRWDLI
ncbi:putative OPA3-like protein3 [Drosophila madeirensis]|uniref:OPA3-like protein3 n=1 Tax=Drosophila madeirensis TaxID=30013 RepID=A0AAU9F7T4_DROMD